MTFRENINRICIERGTTLTTLVKQVKGSSSFATAINKGSLPKESEMVTMANILGCTVMDFFDDKTENRPIEQFNEDERDILRIYEKLSRRQKHELMAMLYKMEEEIGK